MAVLGRWRMPAVVSSSNLRLGDDVQAVLTSSSSLQQYRNNLNVGTVKDGVISTCS